MHFYGELSKIEPQDDGTIKVFGVASTGARDAAGEIVLPDAMKAAIPAYLAFGAIREMHQPSAAGTAIACYVDEAGDTQLAAHIVDPIAVKKVQTGVYKGLSIGGKVISRDPKDPMTITGLKLTEISLVDVPCNPEAQIGLWKGDIDPPAPKTSADALIADVQNALSGAWKAIGREDQRQRDDLVKAWPPGRPFTMPELVKIIAERDDLSKRLDQVLATSAAQGRCDRLRRPDLD
jgi:hypothetical protein